MISTSQFKNGMTIEVDGELYTIIEFQHVKPGKGGAFVRTKLKALKSGAVLDRTFRAGEKFQQAIIETKKMQFLYKDGDNFYFMDNETFDQIQVGMEVVAEKAGYLSEGSIVGLLFYKGEVIGMELPTAVNLRVTKTEPGIKGDTATSGTKPATLETGLTIQVPLFIKEGDVVRVDTRTSTYVSKGD
jgi:elongation factor P